MSDKLVQVEHLQQYFPAGGFGKNKKYVQAVDDVSFFINRGETLGLVGESGCGKTTTGRTLLRLYEPTGGRIIYDDKVIFDKEKKIAENMLPYRKKMQIVFQDPYASLDPRMTVGDIVGEPIDTNQFQKFFGSGPGLLFILVCMQKNNFHNLVANCINRIQTCHRILENNRYFVASDLTELLLRQIVDTVTVKINRTTD